MALVHLGREDLRGRVLAHVELGLAGRNQIARVPFELLDADVALINHLVELVVHEQESVVQFAARDLVFRV